MGLRWPWRWADYHCGECGATAFRLGPLDVMLDLSLDPLHWWAERTLREIRIRLGLTGPEPAPGPGAAAFIPEIWSNHALDMAQSAAVFERLVGRRYREQGPQGGTISITPRPNSLAATMQAAGALDPTAWADEDDDEDDDD